MVESVAEEFVSRHELNNSNNQSCNVNSVIDSVDMNPKKPRLSQQNMIDTHQYSKEITSEWYIVDGRRIVDWTYVSKCMMQAQRSHSSTCSGLLCMLEEKYRSMVSVMIFRCDSCEAMYKVRTEEPTD